MPIPFSFINNSLVPKMIGFTSPYGIASSSSNKLNEEAWRAFGDSSTWASNNTAVAWLQYQFPAKRRVVSYIFNNKASLSTVCTFSFQGSNDGSSFTTLNTQSSLGLAGFANFSALVNNTNKYLYYRFNFTANSQSIDVVGNCQMYGY